MQSIVLLHGALGSDRQLEPLKNHLAKKFDVHLLCFEGHGVRNSDRPLAIQYFSENLSSFLDENNLKNPLVFGYSMGGYVALYNEAQSPGTFSKIVTLGTKFNWTPDVAAREVRMLNPEIIEEKVPKFAAHLSRMHAPNDWKENMRNTAMMMEAMGEKPPLNEVDLSSVNCPVHLLVGEKDTMVSEAETLVIKEQLSDVQFDTLEGLEHPIEKLELGKLEIYLR
ncbi:alpha/beta hydrolase [Crocinitomicaceae bacterium]|nr:alpha/beta hydrolase [Crocinitomicaceae bacterium]MDB3906304.1 alpha/beta hydrolase [Crocinitomicaceae bacterium]